VSLQTRLLAGLSLLVFLAIASTGWLTLEVARGRLEQAEEEQARALGEAVAGVLGGLPGEPGAGLQAGADQALRESARRVRAAVESLRGVGGVTDVAVVDVLRRPLAGEPGDDGGFAAALAEGEAIARRSRGVLSVYAPIRAQAGGIAGAIRLRVAVGRTLGEAVRGSLGLLLALTLTDGGLILLFGALFVRGLVRPLEALSGAAARVAEGHLDVEPVRAGAGDGELGALAGAFNRMTASLREQRANLVAAQAQVVAQEKLATVGRLAAGVAHEIGNPLTAVLGYVELLLAEPHDPSTIDTLRRVRAETERIHRIVHDLLEYARTSRAPGSLDEEREPVRVADVLRAAIDLLRPQPRFREVTVRDELPPELPPIAASTHRLLQVLLNLLLNAADAMRGAGEVVVRGRLGDGNAAQIEVADSGPGVAPEDRARLFDPFFTTKQPGAGTGLGLAVCRSLVEGWGGTIELVPSEQGATFRLTLPLWTDPTS